VESGDGENWGAPRLGADAVVNLAGGVDRGREMDGKEKSGVAVESSRYDPGVG